jgi:CBS domain-containing membrane protein
MAMVIAATPDHLTSWAVALFPVAIGSALLVLTGILWNRATGRVYPFRTRPAAPHGTSDQTPERRQLPSETVLAATLEKLRLGANVGVQDLARLIATAEASTAAAALGQVTAADMMSRDLIAVRPDTPLSELAAEFRTHRFKSLPIRREDGSYGGIVPVMALIERSGTDLQARDLTEAHVDTAPPAATVADLIALMADGRQQTVPIVQDHRLLGLVTRSDLIALMIHALSHR